MIVVPVCALLTGTRSKVKWRRGSRRECENIFPLPFFPCFSRGSLLSVTVSMIPHIQSFTLIFTHCLDKWFHFAGSWFWPNKLVILPIANQSPQFVPEEWWEGTMMLYIAFYILSGIWINTIYPFAQSGFWPHQSALQLQILKFTPLD